MTEEKKKSGTGALPMMVDEAPDPKVAIATCCEGRAPGITALINGRWWLFLNSQNKNGTLATKVHPIGICRGCWVAFSEKTPTRPWTFGMDKQLDEHFRQIARATAEESGTEAKSEN